MSWQTLPEWVSYLIWPWTILSCCAVWNVWQYRQNWYHWQRASVDLPSASLPAAVVWAAVKHVGPDYDTSLNSLLQQTAIRYRIVFSVESKTDPAFDFLCSAFSIPVEKSDQLIFCARASSGQIGSRATASGLEEIRVVIAGQAQDQGQKIHNLIMASQSDDGFGEVVALADADCIWAPHTLQELVKGVQDPVVGICTGYRWIVPRTEVLPSVLAAVINSGISTLLGAPWKNYAWAGAMALRREVLDKFDVPGFWRGKVNDDVSLTGLIKKHMIIRFCPGVTPVNMVDYNWQQMINFGRRQYVQMWHYRWILWFYGAAITTGYVGYWLVVIYCLSAGQTWVWFSPLMVYMADICRAVIRKDIRANILPVSACKTSRRIFLWDALLTPLWMAIHGWVIWSTCGVKELTWGGIRYQISRDATLILKREDVSPHCG